MSEIEQILEILRDFRQRAEANYENRSLVDRKGDYLRGYSDGACEAANLIFLFALENGAKKRFEIKQAKSSEVKDG